MANSRVFQQSPSRRVVALLVGLIAALGVLVAVVVLRSGPVGDPGALTERAFALPSSVPLPVLSDATAAWNVDDLGFEPAADRMAGGAAVADLDRDNDLDLIIANGDVAVMLWNGSGYDEPYLLGRSEAIGVSATDVDGDDWPDLLVATATDNDHVVWGGEWVTERTPAEVTLLPAAGQTSALLAGELSGDRRTDIVRLGRGKEDPAADVLWVALTADPRSFTPYVLPEPDRFSLAGELVDADQDGLLDIWITRDVGWANGGDSVLSRQGRESGAWVDIAEDLGAALEVDGMGITIADLNGDAVLDAYVSDLGDNEQLMGSDAGFAATGDNGAAHIRPTGAADSVVSSTWGTGAIDINLDGVLDLALASGGFPTGTVRNKIDGTNVAVSEPPAILLGIGDGQFSNVWPSLDVELNADVVARGLTVADLDGDGDDDIVIVDRRGSVLVLRNDTTGPTVTVLGNAQCPTRPGLFVTVETSAGTFQRLLTPHGYASAHGDSFSVGNPTGDPATVTLSWPDGRSVTTDVNLVDAVDATDQNARVPVLVSC